MGDVGLGGDDTGCRGSPRLPPPSRAGPDVILNQLMSDFETDGKDFEADSWSLAVDNSYLQQHKMDVMKRQDVIYGGQPCGDGLGWWDTGGRVTTVSCEGQVRGCRDGSELQAWGCRDGGHRGGIGNTGMGQRCRDRDEEMGSWGEGREQRHVRGAGRGMQRWAHGDTGTGERWGTQGQGKGRSDVSVTQRWGCRDGGHGARDGDEEMRDTQRQWVQGEVLSPQRRARLGPAAVSGPPHPFHPTAELIQTEMHHVRTLKIMANMFRKTMLEDLQVDPATVQKIFPCVDELSQIHERFLAQLLERRRESLAHDSNKNFVINRLGDILVNQVKMAWGHQSQWVLYSPIRAH